MYIHILIYRVIFANNYVFGPTINHQLKLKFANLPDNCRVISSREFCPLNFRITDRNLDGMLYNKNNNAYDVLILMHLLVTISW